MSKKATDRSIHRAALTLGSSVSKMAANIRTLRFEVAMSPNPTDSAPRNLFRVIATDIHFWIPVVVLVAGLLLLDKLS